MKKSKLKILIRKSSAYWWHWVIGGWDQGDWEGVTRRFKSKPEEGTSGNLNKVAVSSRRREVILLDAEKQSSKRTAEEDGGYRWPSQSGFSETVEAESRQRWAEERMWGGQVEAGSVDTSLGGSHWQGAKNWDGRRMQGQKGMYVVLC